MSLFRRELTCERIPEKRKTRIRAFLQLPFFLAWRRISPFIFRLSLPYGLERNHKNGKERKGSLFRFLSPSCYCCWIQESLSLCFVRVCCGRGEVCDHRSQIVERERETRLLKIHRCIQRLCNARVRTTPLLVCVVCYVWSFYLLENRHIFVQHIPRRINERATKRRKKNAESIFLSDTGFLA